ncbi:DUF3667 domain-containing protein [uncultured Paraglaciecola sp.]|uniref:DUF3667 domain-containing protein n=1 Tax=uncultured Paraglaciecola sp. TaxID=1765024 RepID=UPI00345B9E96
MDICPNCTNKLTRKDASYCCYCGQSTCNFNQSFKKVLVRSTYEIFDIDGRVATTLKKLLFSPAFLSIEYSIGKIKSYSPPLRMYLVSSLILFITIELFQSTPNQTFDQVGIFLVPKGILEQLSRIMFVMLPIYACILQFFHQDKRYIYNLIFSLHIHSLSNLLLTSALIAQSLATHDLIIVLASIFLIIYLLVYIIIAMKKFFGKSWMITTVNFLGVYAIYLSSLVFVLEIVLKTKQ